MFNSQYIIQTHLQSHLSSLPIVLFNQIYPPEPDLKAYLSARAIFLFNQSVSSIRWNNHHSLKIRLSPQNVLDRILINAPGITEKVAVLPELIEASMLRIPFQIFPFSHNHNRILCVFPKGTLQDAPGTTISSRGDHFHYPQTNFSPDSTQPRSLIFSIQEIFIYFLLFHRYIYNH